MEKRAFVTFFGERSIHALEPLARIVGQGRDRRDQRHDEHGAPQGRRRPNSTRPHHRGASDAGITTTACCGVAITAEIAEWRSIGADTALWAPT
jgi:hypothetical protein